MNIKLIFFIPILTIVLILHIFLLQKISITKDTIIIKKKSKFIAKLLIVEEKKEVLEKSKELLPSANKIIKKVEQKQPIKKVKETVEIKKKIVKKIVKTNKTIEVAKKIIKKDIVQKKENTTNVTKVVRKVDKKEHILKNYNISEKEKVENLNKYILYINNTIEKNKFYPKLAKKMGIEGKCILRFTILRNGTIKEFILDEVSDFSVLNDAALKILQKIGKFKAFPSYVEKDELVLKIPIKYILQG